MLKVSEITTTKGDVFYVRGNVIKLMFPNEDDAPVKSSETEYIVGKGVLPCDDERTKFTLCKGESVAIALDVVETVRVFMCHIIKDEDDDECEDDAPDCEE